MERLYGRRDRSTHTHTPIDDGKSELQRGEMSQQNLLLTCEAVSVFMDYWLSWLGTLAATVACVLEQQQLPRARQTRQNKQKKKK